MKKSLLYVCLIAASSFTMQSCDSFILGALCANAGLCFPGTWETASTGSSSNSSITFNSDGTGSTTGDAFAPDAVSGNFDYTVDETNDMLTLEFVDGTNTFISEYDVESVYENQIILMQDFGGGNEFTYTLTK